MGKEDYKNEKKGHGFLCVPKELLFDNRYKQLTIEAILLYAYMLDRLKLSIENGWKDSDGKVFIYFSLESIMDLLKCSKGKAISTLKELDEKHGIGLIEKKRSGYGKCSRIYVKEIFELSVSENEKTREKNEEDLEVTNKKHEKSKNKMSRSSKIEPIEVKKINPNNTNKSNTNKSNTISDITGVDNIMLGGTLRQGQVAYPFEGTINSVGVYQDVISDDELVQLTGQTTYADNIFYAGDATKSNYFRIPSLLTLDSGTVIAAADARYGGTHDSKSKINTAFAKSTDGGNTWGEPTLPMKFDDYVAKNIDWPRDSVGKNVQIQGSASYIDPVLLEDKSTHRVFLFADLMPAGIGSSNASVGSGFKEINGKKYLKLHWKDDSSSDYNYSIRENGIIYDDTTNASTEYSVDGEYNLYKNGEALTCKQYDYNFEGTSLLETPTDTDVNMNVFYKDSMFKVFPTNYLAMKYSDDEGDNWSDLNIVSTFKPEESKFLVLGPGIGKQITTGENAGRLIVPLYSKSSAELGFMYSDDHGNSWNYVEADHNTGGATAEAQIVEMPDGSLKTYLRTGSGYIAEVTSIDGGETWSDRVPLTEIATTSYGTQLSVINYSQPIDGKPAIILSAPNATNGRKNGKIWIGLINETGQSGVNKYSVEWKYCYSVDTPQMGYSYSCLTELPDGKVGLLYEKYDSWSRNELHLKNILKYEKFTIDELKVQP